MAATHLNSSIPEALLPDILRETMSQCPCSVMIFNAEGTAILANQALFDIMDISEPERFLGVYNIFEDKELMQGDNAAQIKRLFREGGRLDLILDYDSSYIRSLSPKSHPAHRILKYTFFGMQDQKSILVNAGCLLEDYTDRYEEQQALKASEERYRHLVNSMTDWIWEIDRDGRFTYSSPSIERVLGYTPEEIVGKKAYELILPEDFKDARRIIRKATREKIPATLVYRVRRKDGSVVYMESSASPVYNESGRVVAYRGVDRDITEQKLAQDKILDEKKLMETTVNALPGIFGLYDAEGRVLIWNKYTTDKFGPTYVHDRLEKHVYKEDIEPLTKTYERILVEGQAEIDIRAWHIDDQLRWYHVVGARIEIGGVIHVTGWGLDITEQKLAQDKILDEKKLMETTVNALPGIFGLYDTDGRILWWNKYTTDKFGPTFVNDRFDKHLHKDDYDAVVKAFERAVLEGYSEVDLRGRHIDGQWHWYHVVATRVQIEGETRIVVLALDITDRKLAEQRERELQAHKRDFYRRTIMAATEGKLVIVDIQELYDMVGSPLQTWQIIQGEDLSKIRNNLFLLLLSMEMEEERVFDFVLAIGEAITNAYKHADGGVASIYRSEDKLVFIVSDQGPGIEALTLPEIALVRGFSTAESLGMGYKVMIAIAKKVYLATGPSGTTVAVEMNIHAKNESKNPALRVTS